MNFFEATILGIIEGLTEFLPVSSTAHMLLAEKLLRLETTNFTKTFTISIQLGAILAVVVLYGRQLWLNKKLWLKIIAAFLPTAVLGVLFYKIIKTYLLDNLSLIAWTLLIGGVVIIVFELFNKKNQSPVADKNFDDIGYGQAALIGLAQSLSFIPGVSRSAAAILGGLSLKINRQNIVAFSFLLAIPTMLAATGLDLIKSGGHFSRQETIAWLIGFSLSFIVALIVIKSFIKFISKYDFIPFGIYRIILGLIILWLL